MSLDIAISVVARVRQLYPGGLPTGDIRSADEPLLGQTGTDPLSAAPPDPPRPLNPARTEFD